MIIQSKEVWYQNRFQPLMIVIEEGIITEIKDYDDTLSHQDVEGKVLPGFISTHDHGALGYTANTPSQEFLDDWSSYLIKEGVTSFYPTTSTLPKEGLLDALRFLGTYQGNKKGAHYLGVNAEGPMFSRHPQARGAHMNENIFDASVELIEEMLEASDNTIKIITIAPEVEHALEVYEYCKKHDIRVYMGHMNANTQEIYKGIAAGATGFTHLFNGMTSFHHRDVGPIGVGLLDDETYVELIADGVHASEEAIKLVYRCKDPKKIITITDAVFAKGMPPGVYGRPEKESRITIKEDGRVYLDSGRLAGSTNHLNQLVDYQVNKLGLPFDVVIRTVTENPARMMGINKGNLKVGFDADIICVDDHFNVNEAYLMGQSVYKQEK